MKLLALDPGDKKTGFVVYGTKTKKVIAKGVISNEDLIALIEQRDPLICAERMAIEIIISYGQRIGMSTINTAKWVGRFIQAWKTAFGTKCYEVRRPDVKTHVCYSASASDAGLREAICDRYGGEEIALGDKKTPGPLAGVYTHAWAALGVAILAAETRIKPKKQIGGNK